MPSRETTPLLAELVERLASIEHERWAHWQSFVHSKCQREGNDGALLIPAELVRRWEKQIATPYDELTEDEKQSDREQVERYLPHILEMARKIER